MRFELSADALRCRVCGAQVDVIGKKSGNFIRRDFFVTTCSGCGFSSVANPVEDLGALYSQDYYAGRGADPLVDYMYELDHPTTTIRICEWSGIRKNVESLLGDLSGVRWLDYGCGNGGLVRHLNEMGVNAVGMEEGAIADRARSLGIKILTREQLEFEHGKFDVVTAIEVLEHLVDPRGVVAEIRSMLKPGGLLFVTTGNAKPWRRNLLAWSYLIPEIHVSLFEPRTIFQLFETTGFRGESAGYLPGFDEIIRFKVLKNLRQRTIRGWHKCVPWSLVSKMVDMRYRVSETPIGWAN